MGIMSSIDISASGLSTMRKKMNTIASNIANVETTQTEEGGPYKRREYNFREGAAFPGEPFFSNNYFGLLMTTNANHMQDRFDRIPPDRDFLHGVEGNLAISEDEPIRVFDPGHPDADENGYVLMPNINVVEEMVDLIVASRAYEANLTVINAEKKMVKDALEI
ncbi:MAG: flagellar basal body rod protein FlgC [Deferribacteres bacterium]|nr:flagellar basal body rod protein FlgC [candidate division KSB1 bacterium]MCB9501918.1 flagellar basal body rod protein FlgC [Deferribacteres bacterium]